MDPAQHVVGGGEMEPEYNAVGGGGGGSAFSVAMEDPRITDPFKDHLRKLPLATAIYLLTTSKQLAALIRQVHPMFNFPNIDFKTVVKEAIFCFQEHLAGVGGNRLVWDHMLDVRTMYNTRMPMDQVVSHFIRTMFTMLSSVYGAEELEGDNSLLMVDGPAERLLTTPNNLTRLMTMFVDQPETDVANGGGGGGAQRVHHELWGLRYYRYAERTNILWALYEREKYRDFLNRVASFLPPRGTRLSHGFWFEGRAVWMNADFALGPVLAPLTVVENPITLRAMDTCLSLYDTMGEPYIVLEARYWFRCQRVYRRWFSVPFRDYELVKIGLLWVYLNTVPDQVTFRFPLGPIEGRRANGVHPDVSRWQCPTGVNVLWWFLIKDSVFTRKFLIHIIDGDGLRYQGVFDVFFDAFMEAPNSMLVGSDLVNVITERDWWSRIRHGKTLLEVFVEREFRVHMVNGYQFLRAQATPNDDTGTPHILRVLRASARSGHPVRPEIFKILRNVLNVEFTANNGRDFLFRMEGVMWHLAGPNARSETLTAFLKVDWTVVLAKGDFGLAGHDCNPLVYALLMSKDVTIVLPILGEMLKRFQATDPAMNGENPFELRYCLTDHLAQSLGIGPLGEFMTAYQLCQELLRYPQYVAAGYGLIEWPREAMVGRRRLRVDYAPDPDAPPKDDGRDGGGRAYRPGTSTGLRTMWPTGPNPKRGRR